MMIQAVSEIRKLTIDAINTVMPAIRISKDSSPKRYVIKNPTIDESITIAGKISAKVSFFSWDSLHYLNDHICY